MSDQDNGTAWTEEAAACAIYGADQAHPGRITFIIDCEYVITINTDIPGQASWDYLSNCISEDAFLPSF